MGAFCPHPVIWQIPDSYRYKNLPTMEINQFQDERKLIAALLANNESAFRYLINTMYSQLIAVARAIAGSAIDRFHWTV